MAAKKQKRATVEELILKEQELWRSNGYQKEIIMAFPEHKKVPLLARLATAIIRFYGGTFRIVFYDRKR